MLLKSTCILCKYFFKNWKKYFEKYVRRVESIQSNIMHTEFSYTYFPAMISHGPDPCDDDGVGGEEDALPLVSCDTFVAMGDVTQTGEVR